MTFTWGNVSGIDREQGLVVIKPSGVSYEGMKPSDMVVVDLATGKTVEGDLNPSSDTPTHLELYRNFPNIKGVVHTHSRWATIFAQSLRGIPAYGTTQGIIFTGRFPVPPDDARRDRREYELNTGKVIVETFEGRNPDDMPAVLVASHGPFTWGSSPETRCTTRFVLEEVAMMALHTEMLGNHKPMQQELLDKHYLRKHGANAYYGQKK